MAHYRVAKRYAKGLMDFLDSQEKIEKVNGEMAQLTSLVKNSRELQNFLKSPILDHKKKIKIAGELFKHFSPESQTFIDLVIDHGRAKALSEIAEEFNHLYRIKNHIQKAVISSAEKLSPEQMDAIVAKAKSEMKEDVTLEVENKINKDLIGGFVLRIGDKQFDASIQTQLENLKKEFDTSHYIRKF